MLALIMAIIPLILKLLELLQKQNKPLPATAIKRLNRLIGLCNQMETVAVKWGCQAGGET